MKVNEIIKRVARVLDVYGLEDYLERGVSDDVKRSEQDKQTLIDCLNCVLRQTAFEKIRLVAEQTFKPKNGEVALSEFAFKPIKILRVARKDKKILCEFLPLSVKVGEVDEVTIKYRYLPEKADYSGDVPSFLEDEALLLYGVAAEYCLRENRVEEAMTWRSRFESLLSAAYPSSFYIKERRFV